MTSIPDSAMQEFTARQWTTLDLPGSQPLIEEAIQLFLRLIEDPPSKPYNFDFKYARDPGDSGLNYRGGEKEWDGYKDRKIFFHFRPTLIDELVRHNLTFFRDHERLIDVCWQLRTKCQDQQLEFVRAFDAQQGTKFSSLMKNDTDVLRLLAYTDRYDTSTDIIGREHVDQDAFTTALYESQPGLEFKNKNGIWVPTSSAPDQPTLFSGGVAEQWGGLRAVPHRARQLDETRYNAKIIRVAAVYFGHLWKIMYKGDTHRRVAA